MYATSPPLLRTCHNTRRCEQHELANEFTYAGEQVDASGLQYLRARYYDAATGRFASRDPLPLMQRYAYVGGNPVNLVDPSGPRGTCPALFANQCTRWRRPAHSRPVLDRWPLTMAQ